MIAFYVFHCTFILFTVRHREYRKVRQKFSETEAALAKEEAIELPKMKQEKRELGFIILRGEQIISMSVDTMAPTGKDLNFI